MPACKCTFFQRCLSFTTVWFETIQLRWNTTNSKFRLFCLSCLPMLSAQKRFNGFVSETHHWFKITSVFLLPASENALCCKLFVYRCLITELISAYPYIVIMAGITLQKFGGLCTNFSFGRNYVSHRWVAWFSTKKKNCTSDLNLLFEYSTGQKLTSALRLFLHQRRKACTLYHASENRTHSSLGHPFHV